VHAQKCKNQSDFQNSLLEVNFLLTAACLRIVFRAFLFTIPISVTWGPFINFGSPYKKSKTLLKGKRFFAKIIIFPMFSNNTEQLYIIIILDILANINF
jgi:hypothetical protein